jgi:ABC-type transport system involved in multi-copper enzyme maturation permease subunit
MPLHRMIRAELRKILTRGSGWAGLAISALIPLGVLVLLYGAKTQMGGDDGLTVNNSPVSQMIALEVQTSLSWALAARNFYVLKLILLMVTGQLVAGEWSDRTLRSLLVRPVPRWSVLTAKALSIWIYAAICTLITMVCAFGPALLFLDFELEIDQVCLAFLVSWLADAAIITIGILVSTIFPSVVGVVVGTVLFVMFEMLLRGILKGMGFFGIEAADTIAPWMPGNALDSWQGHADGWDERALGGLAILVAVTFALALFRFQRTDVP